MSDTQNSNAIPIRKMPSRIFIEADCAPPERLSADELQVHLALLEVKACIMEIDRVKNEIDEEDASSIFLDGFFPLVFSFSFVFSAFLSLIGFVFFVWL